MSQTIPNHIVTLAPPRVITVTITEEDRQKAGGFCMQGECILSTALARMGYSNLREQVWYVYINEFRYDHEVWGPDEACRTCDFGKPGDGPFYAPSVVGKSITLTRKATQ